MSRYLTTMALAFAMAGTCQVTGAQTTAAQAERPLPAGAEAWSLFGEPLVPPAPAADALKTLEANLATARAAYDRQPRDAEAIIWLGRRLGYLGRYREAIAIFSEGAKAFPGDARFLRHRGHRYLTTRRFDLAAADFTRAAGLVRGKPDEAEPDGQPNARNLPTSTLQFNIYYHLGLAHYVRGEFEPALAAYRSCLEVSKNPDAVVATSHWLYMTLRRLGRDADARKVLEAITTQMDIIENRSYHDLLLVYRGEKDADALLSAAQAGLDRATLGYGIGNWHFYSGRRDRAVAVWRDVLSGTQWASFGAIAAEADLHRLGAAPPRPRPGDAARAESRAPHASRTEAPVTRTR